MEAYTPFKLLQVLAAQVLNNCVRPRTTTHVFRDFFSSLEPQVILADVITRIIWALYVIDAVGVNRWEFISMNRYALTITTEEDGTVADVLHPLEHITGSVHPVNLHASFQLKDDQDFSSRPH